MAKDVCPHCGVSLPAMRDAFCPSCRESLADPPEQPRTPAEQAAFRRRGRWEVLAAVVAVVAVIRGVQWYLQTLGDYYHPR